jgi:predicted nucleotidyltransferase
VSTYSEEYIQYSEEYREEYREEYSEEYIEACVSSLLSGEVGSTMSTVIRVRTVLNSDESSDACVRLSVLFHTHYGTHNAMNFQQSVVMYQSSGASI